MKLLTWLSKIVVGTVLITTITMFTTWYVVNMYVEDIFRQYQLPAMGKKIQFGEFASRLAEELNIGKGKDGGKKAAFEGTPAPTPSPTPSSNPSGAFPSPSPSPNSNPKDQQPVGGGSSSVSESTSTGTQDDAVAVMGSARTEESEKKELVMSTEDFSKKKEALSTDDKMKIFSLVVSKLPQSEVQTLSAILEDGITAQELDQVNTTLKKYLSDTEFAQLMDILNKY